MVNLMRGCYDRYDYVSMYQSLQNFINVDLSNFYLDYGKDILYIENEDAHIRRSMQTVLYRILTELNRLLAPVLVHTAEEIHQHTPYVEKESIHLEYLPEEAEVDTALVEKWKHFMDVRDDVLKALEEARNEKVIGKSLEAKVHVTWNYSTAESIHGGDDDICPRCREVVDTDSFRWEESESIPDHYGDGAGEKVKKDTSRSDMQGTHQINGELRPGIVHRIDKDTSGLLMVAKDDVTHRHLVEQLVEKSVTRKYTALVHGTIPHDKGTIEAPIGRNPKERQEMAVVDDGKEAVTHFNVLTLENIKSKILRKSEYEMSLREVP